MSHRKSRTAYIQWAHVWIIVAFLLLRAVEAFAYSSCYSAYRDTVRIAIINANIITIVLLVATWFRQVWARIALVIMLFIWMGLGVAFRGVPEEFFGGKYTAVMIVSYTCYIAAAIILMVAPSIQKLTSRIHG